MGIPFPDYRFYIIPFYDSMVILYSSHDGMSIILLYLITNFYGIFDRFDESAIGGSAVPILFSPVDDALPQGFLRFFLFLAAFCLASGFLCHLHLLLLAVHTALTDYRLVLTLR